MNDDRLENESRAPSGQLRAPESDLAAQLAKQGLMVSAVDLAQIETAFGHMAARIQRLRAFEDADCESVLQFRVVVRS